LNALAIASSESKGDEGTESNRRRQSSTGLALTLSCRDCCTRNRDASWRTVENEA